MANLETDRTEDKLVHPDFISEIPGIDTEANYKDFVAPQSAAQVYKPMVAQQVAATRENAGLAKNVICTPR